MVTSALDGSGVTTLVSTGGSGTNGVAADSTHLFWPNAGTGTIGRSNLNGTGADETFITGAGTPVGVAVGSGYLFWADNPANEIGRFSLDGSSLDGGFISTDAAPIGVAVDSGHVYWTNGNAIGRANLDGTNVDQSFITLDRPVYGLAVNDLADPYLRSAGRATTRSIKVRVGCGGSGACSIRLTGKKVGTRSAIVPKTVSLGSGKQRVVKLTYSRALRSALARGGRVSVVATNAAVSGSKSIVVNVAR